MTKMQKPTKPCSICGLDAWWLTPDGRYLCGRCHPNPNPGSNPSKEGHALEVLALCDRVRLGNEKLFKAWQKIRELAEDKEEWSRQMDRWNEAQEKLHYLCLELKAKGFHDCLYIENGGKTRSCMASNNPDGFWCQVCPCNPNNPYAGQELLELPGPGKE